MTHTGMRAGRKRRRLTVGLALVAGVTAVSGATASANQPEYHIECWTYPAPNYGEAGGCVEWSNGTVTWYAFGTNGNWWVVA